MEAEKERTRHGGGVNEEKRNESSGAYEEGGYTEEIVIKVPPKTNMGGSLREHDLTTSSTSQKKQDAQLQSARAEMGEVREENQRLKNSLDQMMKDYQTLQMKFRDIVQQERTKTVDTANNHRKMEEADLISLSLGRVLSDTKKDEKINLVSNQWKEDEQTKEGLSLGLDCKLELSTSTETENVRNPSPINSSEEAKEEAGETWPPSKVLKTMRSGDDEALQQNPVKKARVCVRARCDTPTINDGCQWRKYGQKISKGNPCPRAYYRCTIAPSCPVRKQVQRCAQDLSILITTYEGTHNHPLPMSATAMASTTSAAASMLLSGSSSSQPGHSALGNSGLNYYLSDNLQSKQFYLSNNSSPFSSAPSCPTITLDLTTSAPSSSTSSSTQFNRLNASGYPPRYSSTSLNFSSSESNAVSWANGFLSYGNQPHYSRNQIGNLPLERQTVENMYQSYRQNTNPNPPENSIAAATKAITDDPSFQSALVAALTSIIGTGGAASGGVGAQGNHSGGDNFGQKSRWGEQFLASSTFPAAPKGNGCASSFLNETQSTNSQPGSLMFLPAPSLPFSTSKSASTSPAGDNSRDHTN